MSKSNLLTINVDTVGALTKLKEVNYAVEKGIRAGIRKTITSRKKAAKSSLLSAVPGANKPSPNFSDTLLDAVRSTVKNKRNLWDDTIYGRIHIMGSRAKDSGTYRTRFFEGGTITRFAKTYRGKTLKKPRNLGNIKPTSFFSNAMIGIQQELYSNISAEVSNAANKSE